MLVAFSSGLLINRATKQDWVLRSCSCYWDASEKMARGPLARQPPYSARFLVSLY